MAQDLSKDEFSAAAVFESILPAVIAIKESSDDENTKKENAVNFIIGSLCQRRSDDNNETNISRQFISKVRTIVTNKDDIDGIIKYLNNASKANKKPMEEIKQ